jgi:hypothetical protein
MVNKRLFGLLRAAWRTARTGQGGLSRSATQLRWFIESEALSWEKAWLPMSPRRRLWLWRHGFLSRSGVLYDIDEDDYRQYLSDYQRLRTLWINGEQRIALDNKLLFHWMMEPFDEHRVATYGLLEGGRFHDVRSLRAADGGAPMARAGVAGNGRGTADAVEWITKRLREEGKLMAKPRRGGGGNNVMRWSLLDGTYRVDGEKTSEAAFTSLVAGLDGHLVSEVVEQADYAADLFPDAVNTLRILTMYDREADEPYVPIAVHRVGTERSAPLDNFSGGGLAAEVDRETGELSAAVGFPYSGSLDWHGTHPGTGARIEGVTVPEWSAVRERVLDMAAVFSHTPYIGWDVVVTEPGEFTVIEANSCCDMDVLQVHRPLLDDPRVRRFYERHDIIPAE